MDVWHFFLIVHITWKCFFHAKINRDTVTKLWFVEVPFPFIKSEKLQKFINIWVVCLQCGDSSGTLQLSDEWWIVQKINNTITVGFAEFGLMTYEIVPLAVSWAQHVCDSCCICVLFCHVASLMGCAVCVSSSSLCTPSTASQGSACLWKKSCQWW